MSNIIDQLESEQLKQGIPHFGAGDRVKVQVRVKEGSRERLQAYEGVVIAKKNRGLNSRLRYARWPAEKASSESFKPIVH